jgi:hypothetical protein
VGEEVVEEEVPEVDAVVGAEGVEVQEAVPTSSSNLTDILASLSQKARITSLSRRILFLGRVSMARSG